MFDVTDIQNLRKQGKTWKMCADFLGIGVTTLYEWKRKYKVDGVVKRVRNTYKAKRYSRLDERAKELGYESAEDAIRYLRIEKQKTIYEVAELFETSAQVIGKKTPSDMKGLIFIKTEKLIENGRKQGLARANKTQEHIWNKQ